MSESEDKLKELGIATPQLSVAKAIDYLSSKERIKMLSVLHDRKDVARLELMYSMGEALGWTWMVNSADNRLMLLCSCDKGVRARQIVDVVKQPSEKMGMMGSLKEKVSSFIRSEG